MYCCSAITTRRARSKRRCALERVGSRSTIGCARGRTACGWRSGRCSRCPDVPATAASSVVPVEAAHQRHLGGGRRVAPLVSAGQVAVGVEEQVRAVVGEVAVDRAPQPSQAGLGAAVDVPGVEVGADRVDLLAGARGDAAASRVNWMTPKSFVNSSSGSAASKGRSAASVPSWRGRRVSRTGPQAHTPTGSRAGEDVLSGVVEDRLLTWRGTAVGHRRATPSA